MSLPSLEQLIRFSNLGVGTSIFQLSSEGQLDLGVEPNQWDDSAYLGKVPKLREQSSAWETMNTYIPILATMGFKHLRFSLEWNYIEPQPGKFNTNAIQRYLNLIKCCLEHKIEPMLTLYHFTQPRWFVECGGFLKDENLKYFLNYCRYIIRMFVPYVRYWCTINEPAVEAFSGYFLGIFPPHRWGQFSKGALILKNLLKSHVDICQILMKYESSNQLKYGLVHNILEFESHSKWIEKYLTGPLSRFTCDLVLEFLNYGLFNYKNIYYQDHRYKGNCSFINIYGAVQVGFLGPTCTKEQLMGDMFIAIYPKSYNRALDYVGELGLPIYITETGIADSRDVLRPLFIVEFLKIVIHQLAQGANIQGLYFWTFKDNYEWHKGYTKQFGLFNLQNMPKNSAFVITWIMKQFQMNVLRYTIPKIVLKKWLKVLSVAEYKINQSDWDFFKNCDK